MSEKTEAEKIRKVLIGMTPDLKTKAQFLASKNGVSFSELIRGYIREKYSEHEKQVFQRDLAMEAARSGQLTIEQCLTFNNK